MSDPQPAPVQVLSNASLVSHPTRRKIFPQVRSLHLEQKVLIVVGRERCRPCLLYVLQPDFYKNGLIQDYLALLLLLTPLYIRRGPFLYTVLNVIAYLCNKLSFSRARLERTLEISNLLVTTLTQARPTWVE